MKNLFTGKKVLAQLVALSSLFIVSCSSSPDELLNADLYPVNTTVQAKSYSDSEVSVLKDTMKKQSLSLSNEDLSKIKELMEVKPTGEWTPGPENNPKANLSKHYLKHRKDFKPAFENEEDYLKAAIKAANNNCDTCNYYFDRKYYTDDKIVSVIKWNSKTLELTVVRDNGQIATYFTDKTVKAPRFILVPRK